MIKRTKKLMAMVIAASVLSTSVLAGANTFVKGFQDVETDEYLITKVSNTEAGPGQVDGVLTGEEQDRGQSYTWSMVEHGDYLYIGTCYDPISGIFYRNVVENLVARGIEAEKAKEIAKAAIELMYDEAMEYQGKTNPAIIKVNKETFEVSLVYRYPSNDNYMSGYRMATEYNGKLYFVGAGFPTACLLEVDPNNNDKAKIVFSDTVADQSLSSGIRGLVVYDNELVMSMTTDKDSKLGARIMTTTDPASGEWKIIADQDTFLDYPAIYKRDGINGGGIWDLVEFNGSLYATMVTSKTDPETMITNKQGFAMFRGDKDSTGSWSWTEIIGNKENGAKYEFGLGVNEASAGNIFAFKDHLYIGNYNDPMLSLAEIPNTGNMEYLYNDFKNAINLYRLDINGNIEMVGGQANDEFPEGPIGNIGVGLGNNTNQYVWRMGEHNGKLYVGTYDSATISNMFTNLTNGEIVNMSKEEFLRRINQIKNLLEALMSKEKTLKIESELETTEEIGNSAEVITENLESTDNVNVEETEVVVEESRTDEIDESVETTEETTEEVIVSTEENTDELVEVETPLLDNQNEIENLLLELELFAEELDEIPQLTARASDTISVVIYNKIMAIYEGLKPILPEEVHSIIDKLLEDLHVQNFAYYWGLNEYAIKSVKGFDLLVSEDGVKFEVLTNNGFGDEYNHGVRGLASTEEGLFIGTANPFYGAQLWLLTDKTMEPVDPEIPVDPEEPVDPEVPVDPEKPVEPEIPVDPEKPVEPEIPVEPEKPSTDNGKDEGKGNLPNTGGVDSNSLLALATALTIGGGLCLIKKNKK